MYLRGWIRFWDPAMKLALINLLKTAERDTELRGVFADRGIPDLLRQAEKFIFNTGMDRDVHTTDAIRETGFAMAEQGRFHLPFPVTWIEDPFPDDPQATHRRCYLCVERAGLISIMVIEDFGNRTYPTAITANARYAFFDVPIYIDTNKSPKETGFSYASYPPEMIGTGVPAMMRTLVGEVLYAVLKFIVVLGAKGTERERRQRAVRGNSRKDNPKDYPYTIVRVPLDYAAPGSEWITTGSTHQPPSRHFVRGYQWGKYTRPPEEQLWVDAYWRGHGEEKPNRHYEVR